MSCKKRLLLVSFFVGCLRAAGFAQEVTVSGVVRDANTYREIRDVNIYLKDARGGTSSDFAGRFQLRIAEATRKTVVVFRHVAYEPLEMALDSLKTARYVYLQPRVITLPGIEIREERGKGLEIEKDLPLTTAVIESKNFEIRGYVDAGDLLRTDHSIQVEEELSGKKTIAIRGGNPDEVVVLYNGIKLNSAYDNVFDLSLIDLEALDKLEIIKGSNTALYGPEAFSGVINIVPKLQQDYVARFQQRLGTYRSGNWGLYLHQRFNRLLGSYSIKRGGMRRVDEVSERENTSTHHTASLSYGFSQRADSARANVLDVTYIYSSVDYIDRFYSESFADWNRLLSLKYSGDLGALKDLDLSVSLRRLDEDQSFGFAGDSLHRRILDRAIHLDAQKRLKFHQTELTLAYQFQDANLDYTDARAIRQESSIGLQSSDLRRRQHGVVAVAKFHGDAGSDFFQVFDFDVSMRHDRVHDEQANAVLRDNSAIGVFGDHDWQETMFKLGVSIAGYRQDLAFNGYLNFGKNAKFPTLLQQTSVPDTNKADTNEEKIYRPSLNPESTRSLELGVVVTRDIREKTSIYGWQLSANYFHNVYENKFRMFAEPGTPFLSYDNVPNARLSGVEAKSSVFFLRKKVTVELGLSRYFISEKAAFPFKSDFKRTLALNIDHAGYAFQLLWFKESEQAGWIRQRPSNVFFQVNLPAQTNLDVHLSKKIEIGKLKLFANFSGRNLLNGELVLQGLALRDRRFYVTFGAQY